MDKTPFSTGQAAGWVSAEPGVTRRILVQAPQMMMVEVVFEQGAVGALHSHPHVQSSYVAEGAFRVTIDGAEAELAQGAAFIVAPDLVHGVVALQPGRLIDVFTPRRDEFLPAS